MRVKLLTTLMMLIFAGPVSAQNWSVPVAPGYAYGADIGWATQQEAEGITFHSRSGKPTDLFVLLREHHIDSVRLRVWVNPEKGWNGKEDTLAKAKRAQALGQRIMIDFHYSDNWADPGKQVKPAAWANYSPEQLSQAVYAHTFEILCYLKANGINVAWVQPGNEITNGLLWPEGKTDNFANIAAFTNAGYDATKVVYPDAAAVIHIDNGWDTKKARWWFAGFSQAGGKMDIIGLSYYPAYTPSKDWLVESPKLSDTMIELTGTYGKPVMVVEIGYRYDEPTAAREMLADVIRRNQALGALGLGVFWWKPATHPKWNRYALGAMNAKGQFTAAMDGFDH
ncbi:glycosyl hydrolase 53 family protein [Asticcacaulis sp. AC402]|uniref:glycoside hydrolase family 53 protein n=1 Tax=Asticcacaulis sp. AC402 TaxID=1282361 RepID=UPI0003C3E86C|nr:glycosyl hydrolase 53 family protein [Asticcacaulis sp. AC402]ESQ77629.1 hypothetical protein ABAC402_00445 [Asticcacaulis sp. AC402]